MAHMQQISVPLASEIVDLIRSKVANGEYATESEVIEDGIRSLLTRDSSLESWLEQEIGPAYDALRSDACRAVSAEDIRSTLAAEHAAASARG